MSVDALAKCLRKQENTTQTVIATSYVSWCSRAMGTVSVRHSLLAEPINGALMVVQCNGEKLDSLDGTSLAEKDEKRN